MEKSKQKKLDVKSRRSRNMETKVSHNLITSPNLDVKKKMSKETSKMDVNDENQNPNISQNNIEKDVDNISQQIELMLSQSTGEYFNESSGSITDGNQNLNIHYRNPETKAIKDEQKKLADEKKKEEKLKIKEEKMKLQEEKRIQQQAAKKLAEEKRIQQQAAKQLAEEQYKAEAQEKAYKRLMHLLSRSKFYSNFLIRKINGQEQEAETEKPAKAGRKRKSTRTRRSSTKSLTETPPAKKAKKSNTKKGKKNGMKEMLSPEMKKRIGKKMNLSEEDIEAQLNSMSDSEEPHENNEDQKPIEPTFVKPKYLEADLRDYQKEGLHWLNVLYENGLGGILADEMGLGKTIQAIALICLLMEKKQAGPYLIVAPLSTIPNWIKEFERFAPTIPVVLFYGNADERLLQMKQIKKNKKIEGKFESQPVVITTFEIPLKENSLSVIKWRYVIIDEGQRLKNQDTMLCKKLRKYSSISRLVLTGTPLQNNLPELWSLLNFLNPEIFDDLAVFESWFDVKDLLHEEGTKRFLEQEKQKHIVTSLREILKPFMLRRLKTEVCFDLPPKKEVVVYAPMTELQLELYTAVLNRDINTICRTREEKVIIDDENGRRPMRRCRQKSLLSSGYNHESLSGQSSLSSASSLSFLGDLGSDTPNTSIESLLKNSHLKVLNGVRQNTFSTSLTQASFLENENNRLEKNWGQFANITEANRHYLLNLTMKQRASMYKKIVNHPYLVSCPLNDVGLPLVDEQLVTSSGKMLVLDAMLKNLYAEGHKVLLFSTLTTLLDFIEDYLELRPWKHVRLDGTSKIDDRKINIDAFNNDPDIFLFLVSTRAGGVGLNLMGADTVIIYDSDWNPQADIQAMARCHRIGQHRPVMIYKLCTKGSFDELIVDRGIAKRKLEKLVISKELNVIECDTNTLHVMKELLQSTEHEVVNSEKGVFTKEELEKLMDRSELINRMKNALK